MARIPPSNGRKFKPGQSGNPKGRPKKIPSLDKLLNEVLGSADDQDSEMKEVIEALTVRAKKGDVRAAEVLLERAYGKPKQEIRIDQEVTQVFRIGNQEIKF